MKMEIHPQKYKVAIIQKRLAQYRKPFFELLRVELLKNNIELIFIYGQPSKEELQKKDNVHIDWATQIKNREIHMGPITLLWQPCLRDLKDVDLIIVEQASKLLLNYWLFFTQPLRKAKLCFWGHGKSFQGHRNSKVGEFLKKLMSRNVFWWFAYNDLSAQVVKEIGFPESRITIVQNAIDTTPLIESYKALSDKALSDLKNKYSIHSENVCLYIGSMYAEKRIGFLIDACKLIRKRILDFEIIFIGSGRDNEIVMNAAERFSWIHYQGTVFGNEKVAFFKLSKLLLMPGLVGLSIVDAFALNTPIVTTNIPYHSPEIDYLKHGENGMIVTPPNAVEQYANTVANLLKDKELLMRLKEGCKRASKVYTIEAMTTHYANGIVKSLSLR